jgi:hypothetical protein
MNFMNISLKICSAIFICLIVLGCNDGRPKRVAVSGKVTIDGQPLKIGTVQFYSQTAKGRPSMGKIESDGTFSLYTFEQKDGIPLGAFDVSVTSKQSLSKGLADERYMCNIPPKYEDIKTSGIVKKIEGAMNDMTIELTWKGSGQTGPYIVDGNKK